jgi:hypothetical protein
MRRRSMKPSTQTNLLTTPTERLSGMNAYIEGKMKRYSLMFSVNGGGFLVAKLFTEDNAKRVLGGLSPEALAIGAILLQS